MNSWAELRMKIKKIEKEINVYIVCNDNFTYDLILGLDAIREFKLKQDENLRVSQRVDDKGLRQNHKRTSWTRS